VHQQNLDGYGYFRLVKVRRIGFIGLGAMTFLKITVAIIKLVNVKHWKLAKLFLAWGSLTYVCYIDSNKNVLAIYTTKFFDWKLFDSPMLNEGGHLMYPLKTFVKPFGMKIK
jgi:hypothetical protein